MQKGNVNGTMKILTNNMQNGVLPLNDKTLKSLHQKHPKSMEASEEVLLPDVAETIHPIKFENIDGETIRKAMLKTKGGSGPSGMDADAWRKLFVGNSFGNSSIDLCNAFSKSSRLFIIGGHEMRSSEGTTQGDPSNGYLPYCCNTFNSYDYSSYRFLTRELKWQLMLMIFLQEGQ